MALHFTFSLSSFKPQNAATKTQLTEIPNSVKLSSVLSANECSIAQEDKSSLWRNLDNIHFKHAMILKEVKHVFNKVIEDDSMESLYMVDVVQRLGIEHHFKEEIEAALQKQLLIHVNEDTNDHEELYAVALRFRLLRQKGYFVNADVLNKLIDKMERLTEICSEDIEGVIALYEASQLSIEEEDTLDKAGYLSCQLLDAWLSRNEHHHQAKVVANALQYPLHKSLSTLMNRSIFLNDFQEKIGWTIIQELADLDQCILKAMYKNEIFEVSKWWENLELAKEMKFARYEPLKWFMWSMASLSCPRFAEQRIELTKAVSLVYIIDDIFDVHGTLDELILFTDFVNRWELAAAEQLPHYMKICFKVLNDITEELACKIYEKHGINPIDTLKKSWVRLVKSFLVEAKWFASGQSPEADDYLKNGIVSTGVSVVLVHGFFLLGEGVNKETIALMDDIPGILSSVATILRLCDDLEESKGGNQNGHDGSYLECYMKEHKGISAEETQRHVVHMISRTWKRLNQECLTPNLFPSSFTKFCLNAARMVPLMYGFHGNQSSQSLQEHVNSMLYAGILKD